MTTEIKAKNLTKSEAIDLIWNVTHPDYKSKIGNDKAIMRIGGNVIIGDLPDKQFQDELHDAVRATNRNHCRQVFKDVLANHGFSNVDPGVINQWGGNFKDMRRLVRSSRDFDNKLADKIVAILNKKEVDFIGTAVTEPQRGYRLHPFEYSHHQSPQQQHAVIDYLEKHGVFSRFLKAYAGGVGAIDFNVVDKNGNLQSEPYEVADVEYYLENTQRMKHYVIHQSGQDKISVHQPVIRQSEHSLLLDGQTFNYTIKPEWEGNATHARAFDFTTTDVSNKAQPVHTIATTGALSYYLLNESSILAQANSFGNQDKYQQARNNLGVEKTIDKDDEPSPR